jgi:quinol monooxygenase YgiN
MLLVIAVPSLAQNSGAQGQQNTSAATQSDQMELTIFARFHALEGKEDSIASELRDAVTRVRTEPGCLGIEVYRSVRDPRLFWLHSRWVHEAAFDKPVDLPETTQFVERVQRLIDHPFDVTRTRLLR